LVEQLFISHSVADRISARAELVSGLSVRGHSPSQRGVEITTRYGLGTLGDANGASFGRIQKLRAILGAACARPKEIAFAVPLATKLLSVARSYVIT